jgi:hypothetical protein
LNTQEWFDGNSNFSNNDYSKDKVLTENNQKNYDKNSMINLLKQKNNYQLNQNQLNHVNIFSQQEFNKVNIKSNMNSTFTNNFRNFQNNFNTIHNINHNQNHINNFKVMYSDKPEFSNKNFSNNNNFSSNNVIANLNEKFFKRPQTSIIN